MTDSGSGQTPIDARSWQAPVSSAGAAARGTVFGASGSPLAPPGGAVREGSAPVELPVARKLGWTPPPKRGLVPLRPIPFGTILGAPFRLQRRAPRTTLAPALVISLAATALATLISWALTVGPQAALDAVYYLDFLVADALLQVLGGASAFVPLMLALAATALLAGAVSVATSRAVLAERVSFRGLRWRLSGRIPRLVAWTLLVLVAGAAVLALATLLPLLVAVSVPGGLVFAWLIAFFEVIAFVLGGGPIAARLGFTSHVIALEGLRLGPAIARSWRLTRRSSWRLFGSQFAVWIIVMIASFVLTQPLSFVLDGAINLVFPNGPTQAEVELYLAGRTIVLTAATAVTGAFGLVLQTVTGALLYLDTRMRTEGLDLALARYVDERQRGVAVADPFPSGGASGVAP